MRVADNGEISQMFDFLESNDGDGKIEEDLVSIWVWGLLFWFVNCAESYFGGRALIWTSSQ